jgi:hypothetical protein
MSDLLAVVGLLALLMAGPLLLERLERRIGDKHDE